MIPALAPTVSGLIRSSPLLTPMIPLNVPKENALPLPAIPEPSIDDADATPLPRRFRSGTLDSHQGAKDGDYFSAPTRRASLTASTPEEFSGWTGPGKGEAGLQTPTPMTPSGGLMGRLKNFGKNKKAATDAISTPNTGNDTTLVEDATVLEVGILASSSRETV